MTDWPKVWAEYRSWLRKTRAPAEKALCKTLERLVLKHSDGGVPKGRKGAAVLGLIDAAKEMRRINEAQRKHVVELQQLAAEARRTGENLSHRIPNRAFDYGDAMAKLLAHLHDYEKARS